MLLDELPPEVDLELDVYWAAIGGRDPVELIRGLDERLRLLHMKDCRAARIGGDVAPGRRRSCPGRTIVEAGTARGVEWYVVEEDNPRDAVAEIDARAPATWPAWPEGSRTPEAGRLDRPALPRFLYWSAPGAERRRAIARGRRRP